MDFEVSSPPYDSYYNELDGSGDAARHRREARVSSGDDNLLRIGLAFALGCGASVSSFVFGMPGNGEFVPTIWLAGFAAVLIVPGWLGLVVLLLGAAVSAVLLDLSDGFTGLVVLIVAVVLALAPHGALAAAVLRRLSSLGWKRGLRDARAVIGGALVLGIALVFAWFAGELAKNAA